MINGSHQIVEHPKLQSTVSLGYFVPNLLFLAGGHAFKLTLHLVKHVAWQAACTYQNGQAIARNRKYSSETARMLVTPSKLVDTAIHIYVRHWLTLTSVV